MDQNTSNAIALIDNAERNGGMTKEEYRSFVGSLIDAHSASSRLYAVIIAKVQPFDRELGEMMRMAQVAEDRIVAHCSRKLEREG